MVAEHTAIRAEINQRMAIHGALVGAAAVGLAALAANPPKPVEGVSLTLSVTILASVLALLHLHHSFYVERQATYLRTVLLPAIQAELHVTEGDLPTWEQWAQRRIANSFPHAFVALITHASLQLTLVAGVWVAWRIEQPPLEGATFLWIIGVAGLTVLVHILVLVLTALDLNR